MLCVCDTYHSQGGEKAGEDIEKEVGAGGAGGEVGPFLLLAELPPAPLPAVCECMLCVCDKEKEK